ncbi:hypothetical protein EV368DRAFT_83736 [Lentinula lateritia]|nr:hypothetical protein EV368DRAFT_83736 [Lentinula lateritia]
MSSQELDMEGTEFDPTIWIGTGKCYEKTPLHVMLARCSVLEPPPEALVCLPSPDLTIRAFLEAKLPAQSSSISTYAHSAWFKTMEPNMTVVESIETILRRTIPSEDTLEMLECAVGQQWLDGARSIADPRFNRGKDRVPLDAYTMVERVVKDPIVAVEFPTAEHVFGQQKWNNDVEVGKFTFSTYTFLTLLRPVMIGDDVTQSMIQVMQARLGSDEERSKIHYIAASRFASVLQVAATWKKKLEEAYLPASL